MTEAKFKALLQRIIEMYKLSPETAGALLQQILQILNATANLRQKEGIPCE